MRRLLALLMAAFIFTVVAAVDSAQPPQGKGPDKQKGGPKQNLSEGELVDDIVNRMLAFDKNKDGKLTREEIADQRLLRLFDRADVNKTGTVNRDDLLNVAKQMVAEMGGEGGGKGGKGDKGPGGKGDKGPGGKGDKGGFGGKGDKGPGGPGGKGGPPPMPGQVLPPPIQEMLNLNDDQRKQVKALQDDVDARLSKILSEEQRGQLKAMVGKKKQ